MAKQWSDQEGGCVQLGLLLPFSQNFQQQKEKRPDFNLASICLKRFCLLCALAAKSHSCWKTANSTQQTIPHYPGPRLFFSYRTHCISFLFSPPRRLITCPPAPDRKEAGWQSLTFFWFPRLLYSRYPPYTSYACYTKKKTVVPKKWNSTLLEFDKRQDLDSKFSLWPWHHFTVWDVKNSLADKTQPWR